MSHLFNFLGIPSPFSNKVKKIEIGSHITKIQSCGLERMYGLETITIPNSVIDIGDDAFAYDTSLKAIIFPKNITSHELNKEMLIEPYSLEVICIPNGITYIGGFFLYDTKKLKRLCLPDTIIGNDYNSFCVYNANSLEEASFPITLSSIELGNCTFGGATSGLSLKLKQFNLEDINIEMIDTYTFHESKLKNIILPQSCTEIQDNAFSYCYDMETFIMPDTVTTLGGTCFVGCESLKYIYLSANLTEIPSSCFNWCTNLKNLNIPSSVITIGHGAFDSSGLEVIELPNTVQAIGISAFADCNNLIKVKMSKNISAIPAQCFHYTPNLKLIDCLEYDTVPDLANINAFGQEIPIDYYIVVPDELYSEWIAATNWSDASVVSHIISKTNYEMNASNVPLFEHDDSTPEPFPISD